ncbi:MAG TPA: divalent metal cation transporter [Pirellulales bacterium]|nr:divalent metal cation transporter [Pirellulales bacterium]
MNRVRKLIKILGPGFITGSADDDPSGIGTYSQTGAQFGYSQLWTMLFALPFMIAIQEMCGRIGMVSGRGLAGVIKKHYSRKILYIAVSLLLVANAVNIGADLGAMGAAAQLIAGGSLAVWIFGITFITLLLEVFVSYHTYARVLKYFTLSLLAYVLTMFVVRHPWGEMIRSTLVPQVSLSKDYLLNIVAIIGTTISPYLFFWQANQEVEEAIDQKRLKSMERGKPRFDERNIRRGRQDTAIGMTFSNVIAFFIIATTASTLGKHGITSIDTAAQAAEALRPLAGHYASIIFALGIVGTGLLAVPVLAGSASYAIAEAAGWKAGLYKTFFQAHGFYGIITLATLLGLMVNFTAIPPFKMLYYTAVLNGIAAPPLMIFILLVANNRDVMGKYCNGRLGNILGVSITAVMTICSIALLLSVFV